MFEINVGSYSTEHDFVVRHPSAINAPSDNSVIFVTDKSIKLLDNLKSCNNCLVFVPKETPVCQDIQDRHCIVFSENPRLKYAKFMNEHMRDIRQFPTYTYKEGYCIGADTNLSDNIRIEPFCIIGNNVVIGEGTIIKSGAKILDNTRIGANCIIRENAVIGSDGFGFEKDENGINIRIPHFGGVIIEDDVEIGANSVVAQGTINPTVIKKNTKVDAMAMIAHNVEVGESCIITGGTIIGGSVTVGSDAHLGANCTIISKIDIGSNTFVGLGADVFKSVKGNCTVSTQPAVVIWDKSK